ncbi:MAG: hypothetical protein ACR2HC_02155, partial [Thermoleophilaceae bacterium]
MTPEEAAAHAVGEAERRRAQGGYAGVGASGSLDDSIVHGEPSRELLAHWAVIEIEPDEVVYSTRPAGAPITFFKRILVRLLRQYFVELESRQTRFNIALLERLDAVEERASTR